MNTKKQRRETAQKKAKQKRRAVLAIISACAAVLVIGISVYVATRPEARVFAVAGNQSVTLYENGSFTARLAHNVNFSGTFTEETNGGLSTISFTHGGNTVTTQIEDDILLLPVPWRASCRAHAHEIAFPLTR